MPSSILQSVKKTLNLEADYIPFDEVVILHINTVFGTLHQLGVGPEEGFQIEDAEATWEDFLGADPTLNNVKTYMYLQVRLVFDPPATGFHTTAMQNQIAQLEWRINVRREDTKWTDPTTPVMLLEE